MTRKSLDKWQFGDFQTPIDLTRKVVNILKRNHQINPDVIIEPTCGKGSFLHATFEGFRYARIFGFDINPRYIEEAKALFKQHSDANRVVIRNADFFSTDWEKIISNHLGYLLIIGNPPWVTCSELASLNSKNLPEKSNFQNRKGIEAITGAANFDISEWMLLQHVKWLTNREGAIAFLCKYAVARKVMRQVRQSQKKLFGYIYTIDAKAFFKASVEACLFILTTERGNLDCKVYRSLDAEQPSHVIGERDGYMVSNVNLYEQWRHLRGPESCYIWRSGIKHDCSKIMELKPVNGGYLNGLGEFVDCENNYIYPLLKSSDIGNARINSYRKVALVTQHSVGDDTSNIKQIAPKTWKYLIEHRSYLDNRKSSIYKNKPDFSIFGVGDYTFKRWKIAISGLYKKLQFVLIGPLDGKSVVFDDTVNFLSFDTEEEALSVYQVVTSKPATEFLESMVFWDEKRPITTQLLRRLSIREIARVLYV